MPALATPLASTSHPHFVGLALLRSLLQHEDVGRHDRRADAVLDLISLLLQEAPAESVVEQFCRVRRECETACYLALYRLRRWLEEKITVQIGSGEERPLDLAFGDFGRLVRQCRREHWEWHTGEAFDALTVRFEWRPAVREAVAA